MTTLNQTLCKQCYSIHNFQWYEIFDVYWSGLSLVSCVMKRSCCKQIESNNSEHVLKEHRLNIHETPPENCPYLLEHIMSEQ